MRTVAKVISAALLFTAFSCKKKDNSSSSTTPTNNTPTPVSVNSTPFVEFTVDGTTYKFVSGQKNVLNDVSSSKSINTGTTTSTGVYGTGFHEDAVPHFSFEKGTMYFLGGMPEQADFKAFFAPGNYSYSANALNGVEIKWWDSNKVLWSTGKGTAAQAGSIFKIEANKEYNILGYQDIALYATFSCKLYDDNGNSKTLTNGSFVGATENN